MTKHYSCIVCGSELTPEYTGAVAKVFKHGFNSACPNDQALLPRGSDQITVEDRPVIMSGGRKLSYPRAGVIRYFQCEDELSHADYFRGEIQMSREPTWKRCPQCGGKMHLRSVRLHLDGTVEPFVAYHRDPDAEPVDVPEPEPTTLSDQELLSRFLRKVPRKFKRVKLPNSTKRVELRLSGPTYRKNGKTYVRKVVVIADSETQAVTVVMYGCAGWSPELKHAGQAAHIPLDVIIRPEAIIQTPKRSHQNKESK